MLFLRAAVQAAHRGAPIEFIGELMMSFRADGRLECRAFRFDRIVEHTTDLNIAVGLEELLMQ
jgi:hypothetical protein